MGKIKIKLGQNPLYPPSVCTVVLISAGELTIKIKMLKVSFLFLFLFVVEVPNVIIIGSLGEYEYRGKGTEPLPPPRQLPYRNVSFGVTFAHITHVAVCVIIAKILHPMICTISKWTVV
jgi:hypothetical protein